MSRKDKATIADTLTSDIWLRLKKMLAPSAAPTAPDNLETKMVPAQTLPSQPVKAKTRADIPLVYKTKSKQNTRKLTVRANKLKTQVPSRQLGSTLKPATVAFSNARLSQESTKHFEFWKLPALASVREKPPTKISPADRKQLLQVLSAVKPSAARLAEDLFANVGLDFGTSATKVIVRFPLEAGQPTIAIPAPEFCRSHNHAYSWQTVIWLRSSGEFIAFPEPGAEPLHAIKQGILDGPQNGMIPLSKSFEMHPSYSEAAVAYLAYVMRYVRGWIITNRPKLVRKRTLVWSENIGFPVATLEDKGRVSAFRRIVLAARLIAETETVINVENVRAKLGSREVYEAATTSDKAQEIGVGVSTETAAEATGFFQSLNAAKGEYILIDIGALTLDACIFGYRDGKYQMFGADVRPLGVEAYHWFLNEGKTSVDFEEQCDRCLRTIVWHAKRDHIPQTPCWNKGKELPVFLVGGGAGNEVHLKSVKSLGPWLKQYTGNDGIRLVEMPKFKNIDLPEKLVDLRRLTVAWGLSFSFDQIGDVMLASEMEKTKQLEERTYADKYVSKDMI
jgi:hypothetical protein